MRIYVILYVNNIASFYRPWQGGRGGVNPRALYLTMKKLLFTSYFTLWSSLCLLELHERFISDSLGCIPWVLLGTFCWSDQDYHLWNLYIVLLVSGGRAQHSRLITSKKVLNVKSFTKDHIFFEAVLCKQENGPVETSSCWGNSILGSRKHAPPQANHFY